MILNLKDEQHFWERASERVSKHHNWSNLNVSGCSACSLLSKSIGHASLCHNPEDSKGGGRIERDGMPTGELTGSKTGFLYVMHRL